LTVRGKRIFGDRTLPVDVRVTTTPSPPPFVESWRLHEALVERRPTGPVDLFVVGDSLAEYWPDELWSPLSVFNFGVRADKTQHLIWRLEQLPAASVACRDALVVIGTNNLGAGDTAAGIAAGISAVVAALVRVAPQARIHVLATPPCGPDFKFRGDVRLEANRAVSKLDCFAVIDADEVLTGRTTDPRANYHEDKIHLSSAGYRVLSELVRRCLTPAQPATVDMP
jgi:lysophospholipase L1-like esterase